MDTSQATDQIINGTIDITTMERRFLKVYKQQSLLWNPSHPDYSNKYRRNAGYDLLLPIYRMYMPNATRFHIRQKINILRSCYRKELRKYLASRTIEPDGKEVFSYIPTSWKFHALRFLDCGEGDNEMDTSTETENNDHDYEEEQELEFVHDGENESYNEEPDTSKIRVSPLYVEEYKPLSRKRMWISNNQHYTSEEDILEKELTAVGANVACKLQRMNTQQRYQAELLINKVLIRGLRSCLTDETDLTDVWNIEEESSNLSRNLKEDSIDKQSDS